MSNRDSRKCAGFPNAKFRIGVLVERQRAYGRRLCEGAASFACECPDVSLGMLEWSDLENPRELSGYDAFIVRVLDDGMERALRRAHRPVVDVFFGKSRPGFGVADIDNEEVGRIAAEHFISRGFREYAYCGYNGINFSDVRRKSFSRRAEEAGFPCDAFGAGDSDVMDFGDNVVRGERYAPRAAEARSMRNWLRRLPKPVAVFCSHDLRAHQVLMLCRELGLSVPQEVAILGVDDDAILCGFTLPTLSSIDPNAFETGRQAVRIALAMSQDPMARRSPPKVRIKPLRLVVRESTEVYPVDPPWLAEALVYICRNAAHGITAADVLAQVGLSHTTVGATFRRKLGVSVQELLMRKRLEEACRLLRSGLSVTDVARKSGFSSVQYFCRAFAAVHKLTPSAWQAANGRK